MAILLFNPGSEGQPNSFIGVAADQAALDAGVIINKEAIKTITCTDAEFENIKRAKDYPISYDSNDVVTWLNPTTEDNSLEAHQQEKDSQIAAYNNIKDRYPTYPLMSQIDAAISLVEAVDPATLTENQSALDVVYNQDNNYLHWWQVL